MADALRGGLIINEVLVDPNSPGGGPEFDTDGNGTADNTDEFVELYNASDQPIDISGIELWDSAQGNWFTFPAGTILQPGARAVVVVGVQAGGSLPTGGPDDLAFDAGSNGPILNNGGENIVLYDPAADTYISARYNGDALDDPTNSPGYNGFSTTATRIGNGEDFGNDIDGFSIQRFPDGSDTFVNDQTPTPATANLCFTDGTRLQTPTGPRLIDDLEPGDELLTRDNGPQKIVWIWKGTHAPADIAANPALNSITIGKGALGHGLPSRDLRLSRQHRVLLTSKIVTRMFGIGAVLVPAKDLLALPGVALSPLGPPITYFHILMSRHEVLFAEGAPAETLFLGPESLKSLSPDALDEIRLLLGDHVLAEASAAAQPAHLFAKGRKARKLIDRHIANDKPLAGAP
ncbi:Hint domain-containing protein [Aestuariibius sp. 2305UL40-4]|uniref:Hint domain-containing protein n=1 Tax=Aestuariibius violaceus TaxID=3234132 RepID=UPI00348A2FBB